MVVLNILTVLLVLSNICLPARAIVAAAIPLRNLPTQMTVMDGADAITIQPIRLKKLAPIKDFFRPIKSISFPKQKIVVDKTEQQNLPNGKNKDNQIA